MTWTGPPFKGIYRVYKGFVLIFSVGFRVLQDRFLVVCRGPEGFRELREAFRKRFHLFWYLLVSVVTSYGPKSSWGNLFSLYGSVVYGISTCKFAYKVVVAKG